MKKNCKELWYGNMINTCENLKNLWEKYNNPKDESDGYEFLEYGLSFDLSHNKEKLYWQYLLSWGEPSDGIRFYITDDNTISEIKYFYHNWFDGYENYIDNKYYYIMEEIFDFFMERNCDKDEMIMEEQKKQVEKERDGYIDWIENHILHGDSIPNWVIEYIKGLYNYDESGFEPPLLTETQKERIEGFGNFLVKGE